MTNITAHLYKFKAAYNFKAAKNFKVKSIVLFLSVYSGYSWADVVLDGSMGSTETISGPDFEITERMGQTRGNNLFHSFQTFDLTATQSANFSGSASIQNIVGRVTGGPSNINGTISSSINGANLYLLNPAGILFGANATVDISGSFHASTADSLRFTDDLKFYADPTQDPILSSASPAAFGFLADTPAPIKVDGLVNVQGTEVSLVGGDINIGNADGPVTYVENHDGQTNLTSVASQGDVNIQNDEHQLAGFGDLGTITIENSEIYTDGDSGGRIVIRGGKLTMDNTFVYADTTGSGTATKTTGVDIEVTASETGNATGEVNITASEIYAYAYTGSTGNGNDIKIKSDSLTLNNGSIVDTGAIAGVPGSGGDIIVENDNTKLLNGSFMQSNIEGDGDGGDVVINSTNSLVLDNSSFLISNVLHGSTGNGGNILITNNNTRILNGSGLRSTTESAGNSGSIVIDNTDTLVLDKSSYLFNYVTPGGTGNGGDIIINNAKTDILNGSEIHSRSGTSGTASDVFINTGILNISNDPELMAENKNDTGVFVFDQSTDSSGGNVNVTANNVNLDNFAVIRTKGAGTSGGGNINLIVKDSLNIKNAARLITEAYNIGISNAGNIKITSNNLNVIGNVERDNSNVRSSVENNEGDSGDIEIDVVNLQIKDGAFIQTSSQLGANGDINISATDIVVSGYNKFLYEDRLPSNKAPASDLLKSVNSKIYSPTIQTESDQPTNTNVEQGGNINISTQNMLLTEGGSIYTDTASGFANAGNIEINATNIDISKGSSISASSVARGKVGDGTPGNAGQITINSNHLSVDGSSFLNVSSGILSQSTDFGGKAADISINASDLTLNNGAIISSRSENQSSSGNINLSVVNELNMHNKTLITTSALNAGKAGDINIDKAGSLIMSNNSIISSTANQANGGNININALSKVYLMDSAVNTDVASSTGNGGDVKISTNYLLLDSSNITTTAIAGNGGDITIIANSIMKTTDSIINADSKESIDGNIDINTLVDINSALESITEDSVSVATVFADSCVKNLGNNNSHLIVKNLAPSRWQQNSYTSNTNNQPNKQLSTNTNNDIRVAIASNNSLETIECN